MARAKYICSLAAIVTVCLAEPGGAFYVDGHALLTDCTSSSDSERARCDVYILGAVDSYEQWQAWGDIEPQFCSPRVLPVEQLRSLVVLQLREDRIHLNDLHKQASGAVLNALMVNFPCVSSGSLAGTP